MKNKPISHKEQNTFRFASFGERLRKINVDVIHHGKVSSNPGEAKTFFLEAFEKWMDLNYTQDYTELQQEIGSGIKNLNQIVSRQNELIEILLKYLQKQGSQALDAALELTVALARDLQYEFYPHFPKFFSAITLHLSTKHTELLEQLFSALAYLFKFLWKYMIKDIKKIYRLFSSLLDESNKEHIQVFAAESFGFLIRKVQNKQELFEFIFSKLVKKNELAAGVGHLLFEVVKGVKGQFHSCTEPVLKLLLKFLGKGFFKDEEITMILDYSVIEEALIQTLHSMAMHCNPKHSQIAQQIFSDIIIELLTKIENNENAVDHLERVLRLFLYWVKSKHGKLMSSDENIIKILKDLGKSISSDGCMKVFADILSSIMISKCIELSIGNINEMLFMIYHSYPDDVVIHFTRSMFKYGMFEKDILPNLLSFCVKTLQNEDSTKNVIVLNILSEVAIALRPPTKVEDAMASKKLNYYSLSKSASSQRDLKSSGSILEDFLIEFLKHNITAFQMSQLPSIWSTLICMSHLRFLNTDVIVPILEEFAMLLHSQLTSSNFISSEVEKCSFTLYQLHFTYFCITGKKNGKYFTENFIVDLLRKYPKSPSSLHMMHLYLNKSKGSLTKENTFNVLSEIIPNLSSPYHTIRLPTLKILKLVLPESEVDDIYQSICSICLEAEKIPIGVHTYREKLKWLQKLEYPMLEKLIPLEYKEIVEKIPIMYLLGMLYVNFRLLWDPAISILETHARNITKEFWNIFGGYLQQITHISESEVLGPLSMPLEGTGIEELFHQCLNSFCEYSENPDVVNHRLLLWKAMESFFDIVEPRNKIVVPLLFQFVREEMVKVDKSMTSSEPVAKESGCSEDYDPLESTMEFESFSHDDSIIENKGGKKRTCKQSHLKKKKRKIDEVHEEEQNIASNTPDGDDPENQESEVESENSEDDDLDIENICDEDVAESSKSATLKAKPSGLRKKNVTKLLAAHLSVFAKFKNPKAVYRTNELQNLYQELLTHQDPDIQKLSFDCIMTYNHEDLTPYKENFHRIIDNKTFKYEIVLFNVDPENKIIEDKHRMHVFEILMRILYGKMLHKTGRNTAGKSHSLARRSLVLRFLAGCKSEELKIFFDLAFLPFKEQLNDDVLTPVRKIRESLDLSCIVPVRKQHSALNTLGLMLRHFGSLAPELLPQLLKVLLVIASTSVTLLERRDEILPQCVTLLKSVRVQTFMRLIQFFNSFPKYNFSPEEIDATFEAIVWPMLSRLEFESVTYPSPLLRLLASWSGNPRYFVLLTKHHTTNTSFSALPHIIHLLSSNQVKPRVVGVILKIIFQLLTLTKPNDEEEEHDKLPPLQINCCLKVSETTPNGASSNFGTSMLLPFVSQILSKLQEIISKVAKKNNSKLSSRDLTILLRISDFIDDAEQCSKLIQMLMPFFHKLNMQEDLELLILSTISKLIKKVKQPHTLLKFFATLFGKFTNQTSRIALAEVISSIAECVDSLKGKAEVIANINAYDQRLVGEPDYQRRLDGNKEAIKIIRAMTLCSLDTDFIQVIIYNSTFVIRMSNDRALCNNSSHVLKEMIKSLSELDLPSHMFELLISETLLVEIQKGIKHNQESVRHAFIGIFSVVLEKFPDQPQLVELVKLCNKDRDLDFWENICHIQLHRRSRALVRFSNDLKQRKTDGEQISNDYILSYMLPIVKTFFFDTAYQKHSHVIDAAVVTLGTLVSLLPWKNYELLLKEYLDKLSKEFVHHKTVVKIIVSILDAFPFNLKSCTMENRRSFYAPVNTIPMETETKNKVNTDSTPSDESIIANDIFFDIKKTILPLLHRSLMKKSKRDDIHKLANETHNLEHDVVRVPIALATVKLLQKMPFNSLDRNLPRLFLKMCELLKSKEGSIRETARETLIKMMQSIGPKYFHLLLTEMRVTMKKGYQVHVMTYTINAVLMNIMDQMGPECLDSSADNLIKISMAELFTDIAEEKEVEKITVKVKEARSVKSYTTLQTVSKFVSENYLLDLITPLKEILATKHNFKTVKKAAECLHRIALGLSENNGVSVKAILIFIHALCTENIPGLTETKPVTTPGQPTKFVRPDIYIVPKDPGRAPRAKINIRTNVHILVTFGLQVLHLSLKKDKIVKSQMENLQMLDPIIPLVADCLNSGHVKIISTALRCLMPLYKYPLPSLKSTAKNIVNSLFILLNKYSAIGMGQGENFEMVVMCFKMLTIMVRDTNYHKLSDDQLHALLSYIAQDIYDHTKQATAFTLLKAILSKKLEAPELRDLMFKIAVMSITSERDPIRAQCRQACLQYILDYPLGKKIKEKIQFFASQLKYHDEHGRISALEMINSMLTQFSEALLKSYSELFLVHLATMLVNDEATKCKKMAAECIKLLLTRVDNDKRNSLFLCAKTWLEDKKHSLRYLGMLLYGLFVEVEGEQFEHRFRDILPFMLTCTQNLESKIEELNENNTDHFLYALLVSLTKAFSNCPVIRKKEYKTQLNELWEHLQRLILHPHSWVRLATSQLFGLLFSNYTVEEILKSMSAKKKVSGFLCNRQKLRDLSADFATQLQSPYLDETLGDQVVRNLVYLAKVISSLPNATSLDDELSELDKNGSENADVEVTLAWMVRRLCREAKKEVAVAKRSTMKRKHVFMFLGAISHEIDKDKLLPFIRTILLPLCREVTDQSVNSDETLKKYAQEVLDLIEGAIGTEEFTLQYANVQLLVLQRRAKRKQEAAEEAITNPEKYARKKIKKQQNKKESKKRKILKQKGKKNIKKPKLSNSAKKSLADLAIKS